MKSLLATYYIIDLKNKFNKNISQYTSWIIIKLDNLSVAKKHYNRFVIEMLYFKLMQIYLQTCVVNDPLRSNTS